MPDYDQDELDYLDGAQPSYAGPIAYPPPVRPLSVARPIPEGPFEPQEFEEHVPRSRNDLSDLFEVPQPEDNDMTVDDLVSVDTTDVMGGPEDLSDLTDVSGEDVMGGPEDLSDLTDVSGEDVMGTPPRPGVARRVRKVPRFYRRYPPAGLGGMNR